MATLQVATFAADLRRVGPCLADHFAYWHITLRADFVCWHQQGQHAVTYSFQLCSFHYDRFFFFLLYAFRYKKPACYV
jgi:hypothetical protein